MISRLKRSRICVCAVLCLLGLGVTRSANATTYTLTDLYTLGGSLSQAYGINNAGQVVGISNPSYTQRFYATIWNGGVPTDLGTLLGGLESSGQGINNAGQVVGWSSDTTAYHATIWNGGVPTDLGTLGGLNSFAWGINNAGQVVGYSNITDNISIGNTTLNHATIWNRGVPTDLGALPGAQYSEALGINDAGQVAGYSVTISINFSQQVV